MTKLIKFAFFLACIGLLGAKGCTDCQKLEADMKIACAVNGENSPECLAAKEAYKAKCEVAPTPTPTPTPPDPTPPPENPCPEGKCIVGYTNTVPPTPICGECPPPKPCEGVTCNPGYHCDLKTGQCVPDITPPPTNPCPKELADGAYAYMNDKAYGNGFDSTVRVHGDVAFCQAIHGEPINDCHLEGWPQRVACEIYLIGGCPVWQFKTNTSPDIYVCHDDHNALASCDHFGDPANRDDPQTPTSGDTLETLVGFEGEPKQCGLQRDQFGPMAGYFVIAHGGPEGCLSSTGPYYQVRACKVDYTGCGPWRNFCK